MQVHHVPGDGLPAQLAAGSVCVSARLLVPARGAGSGNVFWAGRLEAGLGEEHYRPP